MDRFLATLKVGRAPEPRPPVFPSEDERTPAGLEQEIRALDHPPLPWDAALGAIASYATARDVPRARVVFCDAVAYDAGYLPVEDVARRVRVRGRGGTILQPGVDLPERAGDFPPDGPILVITDAGCDVVRIRREHAFLIPEGAFLPFAPRGPVFRMS